MAAEDGPAGDSAGNRAQALRKLAAEARLKADRMESMAAQWEAGVVGERRVAAALEPLAGEHCRLLHDRLLHPGRSRVNLDHIVISVAGTYLIDAKNFSGEVTVQQGSLRQRISGGSSRRLDDKLDKVRRMAEQMESSTSCVVDPVLCLAGEGSAAFGAPVVVRGVFVVPVEQLAQWLLSRPRTPAPVDLRSLAVRLAASFPSATEPAFLAITPRAAGHRRAPGAPLRAGRRQPAGPAPRASRASRASRTPRTPRASTPRATAARALAALAALAVLLVAMTIAGQHLVRAGGKAAGSFLATQAGRGAPSPTPGRWIAPCTAVSDAAVAAAVGHPVYRYLDGVSDSCSWGFTPRPNAAAVGSIRLITGWNAKYGGYPVGASARYSQNATSQVLTVPQLKAVPDSAVPPALITQPIAVVISWRSSPVSSDRARQAVTVLAGEVAKHLPIGPAATTITRR